MLRKFILLLTFVLWSAMTLTLPKKASAETVLTRAVVQNLRNLVRLIPQNSKARPARVADAMTPGDALSTGRSSLVELRFNDGSLARIGERAVFRFLAHTRNFKLSNGTVLLLIPPGRGITGVQTPNAAAAIRGSALFVRYIPDTDTTIVGSLTDSNIEVFNESSSQSQVLEAGQMAVIVNDRIESLYEFDLNTFYETSDLVQNLDLNQQSGAPSPDPGLASVQAETSEAAVAQPPVTGEGVIENPAFVEPPASSTDTTPADSSTTEDTTPDKPPVENPDNPPVENPDNPSVETPDNLPVETPDNSPVENPVDSPVENPDNPPVENLDNPPVENPDNPPVENLDNPPVETPDNSPVENLDNPPVEIPDNSPVETPVDSPVENLDNPPVETPDNPLVEPLDNPPVELPVVEPPDVEPPAVVPF